MRCDSVGVLSPVVFPDAVVVPSAGFRVSRVAIVPSRSVGGRAVVGVRVDRAVIVVAGRVVAVVVAGRAVVAVFSVDGMFNAGSVDGFVLPVFSVPAVVPRRVGERGGGVEVGRVRSKRDG